MEFPSGDRTKAEIFAYCDRVSYAHGEAVRLMVHTTLRTFDAEVFLDGEPPVSVYARTGLGGRIQQTPADAYERGCGWQDALEIPIAKEWPSGFYLIRLTVTAAGQRHFSEAGFVVRPSLDCDARRRLLLVLTTGTYAAYNDWGGANAYRRVTAGKSFDGGAPRLSLDRPWARGFLRLPLDAPRHTDIPDLPPHSPPRYPYIDWALTHGFSRHYCDAGWAYYERHFWNWAKSAGYEIDLLTQHDLHEQRELPMRYPTMVIVGHDEYWTWEMRDAVDDFVHHGGHLARFAGNFLWQVRLEGAGRVQVCYKNPTQDPVFQSERASRTTTYWDARCIGRPAAATMGLTGAAGIYSRFGAVMPRASGGYTVYRPEHWVFSGTDLYYGDVFGGAPARIASYEVDGVDYTFRDGLPYPTFKDAAPADLEILAMVPAARGELKRHEGLLNAPLPEVESLMRRVPPFYELPPGGIERGAGMIAIFESGAGTVFNAGCSEWISGLLQRDFYVEQITHNVLNRFLIR
jgi:hypothetical protein